jgi:hypothetical protein
MKKIISSIVSLIIVLSISVTSVFAYASHDSENPTQLTIGKAFASDMYYANKFGDHYTFTITKTSDVSIWAGTLPINHSYTMALSGIKADGDGIEAISTSYIYNDALEINSILEPGTYYIDFTGTHISEPGESAYNMLVTAVQE